MQFSYKKIKPFGALIEPNEPDTALCQESVKELRKLFDKEQFLVLRGFREFKTIQELIAYSKFWGEISLWPFGEVLELKEQEDPKDHIFDHNYVPLHWDGMYRPQVPEIQIFQCVDSPKENQGGRTTFTNTRMVLENVEDKERAEWSSVIGSYERNMEFYHSKTIAPLVTKHPFKDFEVIRYCEPPKTDDSEFLNHPEFSFEGVRGNLEEFYNSMKKVLYDDKNFYAHEWQKGDIVVADNFTLLHGREAFTRGASRHLRRVHVLGKTKLDNPHLVFHR